MLQEAYKKELEVETIENPILIQSPITEQVNKLYSKICNRKVIALFIVSDEGKGKGIERGREGGGGRIVWD